MDPDDETALPPAVQDALALMRAEYAGQLPARLAEVRAAWRAVRAGAPDAADDLHRAVHYLAGTGATFGQPGVSDVANRLEAILLGPGGADADPAEVARLIDDLCGPDAPHAPGTAP